MSGITSLNHNDMVSLLNDGKEEGLSYYFSLHSRSLKYFAIKLIQDQSEAEDIVAMCFHKLWQSRADFNTGQQIKGFLFISCKNACLNYLRGLKRRTASQALYLKQFEENEETILHGIIETELLELLNAEIELLPEKMREIFKLVYFEGMKTDEIAAQLNLSVKTVRNQKAKAVEILRANFLKKGIGTAMIYVLEFFLGRHL